MGKMTLSITSQNNHTDQRCRQDTRVRSAQGDRRGFTLLELLLVVFIMSVLAISAVSLTDNLGTAQDQYRIEASKNQGIGFRDALIQVSNNRQAIAGFVSDMGALPSNMMELSYGIRDTAPATRFPAFQLITPVFDPLPTSGFNDLSGDAIHLPSITVGKGFRGQLTTNGTTEFFHGAYLNLGIGSTTDYKSDGAAEFEDGWGNSSATGFYVSDGSPLTPNNTGHSLDDLTHGWLLTTISDASYSGENFFGDTPASSGIGAITLASVGRDGLLGGTTPYEADQIIHRVFPEDWSVAVGDTRVEVHNDLPAGNSFENQYDVNQIGYKIVLLACNARDLENPLNGNASGWRWAHYPSFNLHVQIPTGKSRGFTLTSSASGPARIPVGQHVLLLVRCNSSGGLLSNVEFPAVYVNTLQDGSPSNTLNEVQQIRLSDGATQASSGSFRIWVDRDGFGSGTASIASAPIPYDATAIEFRSALFNDNGAGQTVLEPNIDDVMVSKPGPHSWEIEFQFKAIGGGSAIEKHPNLDRLQIDTSGLLYSTSRIHAAQVTVPPGQSTTLRLNLSVFTP